MSAYCLFLEYADQIPEHPSMVCYFLDLLLFIAFQKPSDSLSSLMYRFSLTFYDIEKREYLGDTYYCPPHSPIYGEANSFRIQANDILFFYTPSSNETTYIILELDCLVVDPLNRIRKELSTSWAVISLDSSGLSSDLSERMKKRFSTLKHEIHV